MERGFLRLENGDVQLTMCQDDYDRLLLILGAATAGAKQVDSLLTRNKILGWINRVSVPGNPNMLPYEVSERERDHPYGLKPPAAGSPAL